MRALSRPALDPSTVGTLSKMQANVNASQAPAKRAQSLWKARGTKPRRAAFDDVRDKLEDMAGPTRRCVYCEDSKGTDIDHFRPKSTYPGFAFVWENYLLACSHCNSNEKRADFPLDRAGAALLVDPANDDPFDHLVFVPTTGYLSGFTPKGQETEKVFGLNRRQELTLGRQTTWTAALALFRDLTKKRNATPATYGRIVGAILGLPFQAVVYHLVRDADGPKASVPPDVVKAVKRTRGQWVGHYL